MPKILLVDDDTLTIELFTLALQRRGFDIRVAFNGEQALELASVESPDAILLDVLMPGPLSANDVYTRIRSSPITANTPILIVSAATDSAVRTAVPGATAYVSKPVNLGELASVITELLENRASPFATVGQT